MITIVAKLKAAEGKADDLKAVLTEMVGNVKQHESAQVPVYSLHTSDEDPSTFLFYEQYSSAEGADAHGKTDHMRTMGRALRDQSLLAGAPVIERYTWIAGVS